MDIRKTRILLRLLEKVKLRFPETTQSIKDCLEKEFLKENISVNEVIFLFTYQHGVTRKQRVIAKKIFFILWC